MLFVLISVLFTFIISNICLQEMQVIIFHFSHCIIENNIHLEEIKLFSKFHMTIFKMFFVCKRHWLFSTFNMAILTYLICRTLLVSFFSFRKLTFYNKTEM